MHGIFCKRKNVPYQTYMLTLTLKRTPVMLGILSFFSLLWIVLKVVLSLMSGWPANGTVTIFQDLTQRFSEDTADWVITAASFWLVSAVVMSRFSEARELLFRLMLSDFKLSKNKKCMILLFLGENWIWIPE